MNVHNKLVCLFYFNKHLPLRGETTSAAPLSAAKGKLSNDRFRLKLTKKQELIFVLCQWA